MECFFGIIYNPKLKCISHCNTVYNIHLRKYLIVIWCASSKLCIRNPSYYLEYSSIWTNVTSVSFKQEFDEYVRQLQEHFFRHKSHSTRHYKIRSNNGKHEKISPDKFVINCCFLTQLGRNFLPGGTQKMVFQPK